MSSRSGNEVRVVQKAAPASWLHPHDGYAVAEQDAQEGGCPGRVRDTAREVCPGRRTGF